MGVPDVKLNTPEYAVHAPLLTGAGVLAVEAD